LTGNYRVYVNKFGWRRVSFEMENASLSEVLREITRLESVGYKEVGYTFLNAPQPQPKIARPAMKLENRQYFLII